MTAFRRETGHPGGKVGLNNRGSRRVYVLTADAGRRGVRVELPEFISSELDAVLRFARALVGERGTAEDIVQDVMARLIAEPERFAAIDHPGAYVRRMVANRYVSWGRKWFRVRPTAEVRLAEQIADPADRVAEAESLKSSLARLPRNQRAVLVMRFYAEMDDDEIAQALGCSAGTVRSHASRALATLRVALPAAEAAMKEDS